MMRFSQCEMGPSPLLIYEVYIVYSGPLIPESWSLPVCNQPLLRIRFSQCTISSPPPPGRWDLPSVQWAPHPFRDIRLTIPSVEYWGLHSVQWAPHPRLCLGDEVHPIYNQPHLQSLLLPEMKRTNVQPVPHPSWEIGPKVFFSVQTMIFKT